MQSTFLAKEQCCLYVLDPQERLMAEIHEAERVRRNIILMIRAAGVMGMPIFATTQYRKGLGPFVPGVAELLEGVTCPDKMEFNGFANPDVRKFLTSLPQSVDTMLICGVESHICVYQSALGALRAGYRVRVIADAISSRTAANDRYGQERLRELGVGVMPAEMLIYELLQRAGTSYFKAMLPFLK